MKKFEYSDIDGIGTVMTGQTDDSSFSAMDVSDRIVDAMPGDADDIYDQDVDADRNSDEPRILMVKGSKADKSHVMSLSRAIMMSLSRHNIAELQAIGPPSVNNMIKAFIKAKSTLQDYVNDGALVGTCSFQKVRIKGKLTTAIRMRVFAVPNSVIR